ncbi:MAG: hypothetical protein ACYC26_04145 [Phycisphaerales bacterium]
MTDPIVSPPSPLNALPPRRSSLLLAAGIVQLILGVLCVAMSLMMLVVLSPPYQRMLEEQEAAAPASSGVLMGFAVYALLAVLLMWTGVGALKSHRWVPPVMLCVSWGGLVGGIIAMVSMFLMFPAMLDATQQQMQEEMARQAARSHTPMPPEQFQGMMRVILAVTMAITSLIYVVLPAFFVWLYSRPAVRRSCEIFDPRRRWTDRCPTPAIGVALLALMMSFAGVSIVFAGVAPAYTTLISGLPARILGGALIAAGLFCAKASIQLRPIGWWGCLILMLVLQGAYLVFNTTQNAMDYYRAMGLNARQLKMVSRMYEVHPTLFWPLIAFWLLAGVGFLLWARRFVRPSAAKM